MRFVGAIHTADSPNYDSLCWFIDEVLPLVERELGYETRLTVAGYTPEDVTLDRFKDHPRVTLRGYLASTEPLYNAHRVFVVPTRFAAGAPYKVYEAACFGLPVVATELICGQLGWENGREILSAQASDPGQFAKHVVALYRDARLWDHVRTNAASRMRVENDREQYVRRLQAIL